MCHMRRSTRACQLGDTGASVLSMMGALPEVNALPEVGAGVDCFLKTFFLPILFY